MKRGPIQRGEVADLFMPEPLEEMEQPLAVLTFKVEGATLGKVLDAARTEAERAASGRPFETHPIECRPRLMNGNTVDIWGGEVTVLVYAEDAPQ